MGKENYYPIVEGIRGNLRSEGQTRDLESKRETCRFLSVVACPDDQQETRLHKDNQATLKWDVVEDYVGPAANIVKESVVVAIH